MSTKVKRSVLALVAAIATGVTGAAQEQQGLTDKEIKIGYIMPLSGPPASLGLAILVGTRIAAAEINAQGGINGRQIKVIAEDDGYVPMRTVQGVRKLIHTDKVFAMATLSGSSQGQAALPLIKESGIPVVSADVFHDDLFKPMIKNVFTIGTQYSEVAATVTREMAKKFPNKKWAIVSQDDEYGELTRAGFEAVQRELKLNVVMNEIYKKGQTDFSAEMLKAKAQGAEVLYAGGLVRENSAMAKELERINHKIPMGVAHVSRVPAMLQLMGSAGENVYSADYIAGEDSARGKAFMVRAAKLVSEDDMKRINRYTFVGYTGAITLFEAIKRCGKAPTWACTITQLEATKNLDAVVVPSISFSATNHLSLQKLQLLKASPQTLSFSPID
ncbi:MAG: ABC transporter substrate-binding protein [Sulfuricaulis sp.]|nr:ABC transporter substrate-binding protein [Sulfuricaulis sp.]